MHRFSLYLIISIFIAIYCLSQAIAKESKNRNGEEYVTMVYAVKSIPKKTKLTKDMFREEIVPLAKLPQSATTRIYELVGRIAQYDIKKGAIVSDFDASGLYAPKGDENQRDPIPCIYDTSTNTWTLKKEYIRGSVNDFVS